MEALWGKITNLSYEIFGVFVPGAILLLFATLWWFALGDAPARFEHMPVASVKLIQSIPDSFLLLAVSLAVVYFSGHLLVWISRKPWGPEKRMLMRVLRCLHFRIPRSAESFDEQLKPMMHACAARLGLPIDENTWRRFYPLAKIILAQKLSNSLVSIYQNKYTLHRSITAAATILFWLSAGSMVSGAFLCFPDIVFWDGMVVLLMSSLVVIWGFSASADYYWKMFGNVVVTEMYAVLSGETK